MERKSGVNEVELLFTQILNCDRPFLYLNRELPLNKEKAAFVSSVLRRRISGEPIQYILGKAEFMGLEFKVNESVFIPRPETEILVEKVLDLARSSQFAARSILDIGTGSGCIAISLAKFIPELKIDALDISKEALELARENAKLNNVNVNFLQSDLFNACGLIPNTYDLIISNPPYIPSEEITTLQPEVMFEPRIALDGGEDGLNFYRRIISEAPRYLKRGGYFVLEMGFGQCVKIKEIFKASGQFEIIGIIKDYNDIERVIVAMKE